MTFSTPLLTDYGSEGYFKGKTGAITLQNIRTAVLNLSFNIFNNKVVFMEID